MHWANMEFLDNVETVPRKTGTFGFLGNNP